MITTSKTAYDQTIKTFLEKYPILRSVVGTITTETGTMAFIGSVYGSPLLEKALG